MVLLLLGLTWHLEERNDFTLNGRIKEGRKDPERKGQTIMAGLHILTIITLPKFFLFFFLKLKLCMLNMQNTGSSYSVFDVRTSYSRRPATY